ncbi:hypothetical protein Dimus_005323 [Dionaea muscipula]
MDHHRHQQFLNSRYVPLRPPPPQPPPSQPFPDDSTTFYHPPYHPSNPRPPPPPPLHQPQPLLSHPHPHPHPPPPPPSFHHHRHHNHQSPNPPFLNNHHLRRHHDAPIPRQPHHNSHRDPQDHHQLDHHHHHHHHLPQSPRALYDRDRLRLPPRSPPRLEPRDHSFHINGPNLWEPHRPRAPPPLPIERIELDREAHHRPLEMELMPPYRRGGGGIHEERILPHLRSFEVERMSPPPLVRVDRIRRDSELRGSRFRDSRGDADGFVNGGKSREGYRQLENFVMSHDEMENGFDRRGYQGHPQFRLREMELRSGDGEFFREMMMPDERLIGTGWDNLAGEDGGHDQPMGGGAHSPAQLGVVEYGQDSDRFRGFHEKGKNHGLKSERHIDWDGREEVQEFNRTPRKKLLPKKSAFLRMKPSKHSFRNRIDPISSTSQHQEMEFTDQRLREEREESPVELDVSFKSNALVAKAVKAPSASAVVCNEDSSPKNINKKDMTSEVSGSVTQLVVVGESPSKVDAGEHCGSESYISVKEKKHSDQETRGSVILKKKTHVSDSTAYLGSSNSLSGKNTERVSPRGDTTDKKESAASLLEASPRSVWKKRKIACPSSLDMQMKNEVSVNVDILVNNSPANPLSDNYVKLHQASSICGKGTVPADAGFDAFFMNGDGVVDGLISEASITTNKRKQNTVKHLPDSSRDVGFIDNKCPANPEGSVGDTEPTLNSDESVTICLDKSSSSIGTEDGSSNSKGLVPALLNGCTDGSSDHVLSAVLSFSDGFLASDSSLIHEAATVSSQPCEKQPFLRSEISKSEVLWEGKFAVRDSSVTDFSRCNDFNLCEKQPNADAYSFRTGDAFCSDITTANSKELTTDLNSSDITEMLPLAGAFAVSSYPAAAEGLTQVLVEMEGELDLFSGAGDGSNNLKKRKPEADLRLPCSRTADVVAGDIPDAAITFNCSVEAVHPAEERIAVAEFGFSNVDSKPYKDEPFNSHGCSTMDTFLGDSPVSGDFDSDPTVAFPSWKKQKVLPQRFALSSDTSFELYETPASSELQVVAVPLLSHPMGDSFLLGEREQASGSDSGFECFSAGLTLLHEKSATYGTCDIFCQVTDDRASELGTSNTHISPVAKQSSLLDDQSPYLSESTNYNKQDMLMDAASYVNKTIEADILGTTPAENDLDNCGVKDPHSSPLEFQTKDFDCGLSDKDTKCEKKCPLNGELPSVNCGVLCTELAHHSGMTSTSCMVDKQSNFVNRGSLSTLNPKSTRSIAAISVNYSSERKVFVGDPNTNENSLVGGCPPTSISGASTDNSNMKLKSENVDAGDHHADKTRLLSSQVAKTTQPGSNAMSRELSKGKRPLNYVGTKVVTVHPFVATPSSQNTSTPQFMKTRTWHRSDKSAASNLSLKGSSLSNVTQKKPPSKKGVGIQGNTYIRKGSNSIVRAPASAAVAGTSTHSALCDQSGRPSICNAQSTDSNTSELEFDGASNCLGSGGGSSPLEMPKTPPLLYSSSLSKSNAVSLDECRALPAAGASEAAEEEVLKSSVEALKFSNPEAGSDKNVEGQGVQTDGYHSSCNKSKLIYIKNKSNQLVVASTSVNAVDAQPSSSSNRYFKRSKNQLVRASSKSHMRPRVTGHNDVSNSNGEMVLEKYPGESSLKGLSFKDTPKLSKPRKFSLVWTLHNTPSSSNKGRNLLQCQKLLPNLLPWKRPTYWRSFLLSADLSNANSMTMLRRKLLSSRKRDVIYTRSGHGFTLRRSKVVSVGGYSLKWSKSIEKRSKKSNKAATLAVAKMQRKKQEKTHVIAVSGSKRRNSSRDRIFRIGMFRYKMDPSGRTLQRISDEEPSSSDAGKPEKHGRKPYVPKRLLIGNDEYVQVGNGNQLIRDPKRRKRILASEKVRWSLHTARMLLAKKRKYCQFFTRFGKCNKDEGKCPYIHDSSKIAVCTRFLNGICSDPNCKLTHKVIPERMPDCSFFLQGMCSNESCPYRHVNVNPKAGICGNFLKGYCAEGNECRKKHSYFCPVFEATGSCPEEPKCKLYHRRKGKAKKWRGSEDQKNSLGRYFGVGFASVAEPDTSVSRKLIVPKGDDDLFLQGRLADYISLDVSDDEEGEDEEDDESIEPPSIDESGHSGTLLQDLDELTKPVRLLHTNGPNMNGPNDSPPAAIPPRPEPSGSSMDVL